MPQLEQIAATYGSQVFWLLLTFGFVFFVVGRGMVPKIERTVEDRNARIAADLRAAEEARAKADRTEEGYRARLTESRAETGRVIALAKDLAAQATAARVRAADEETAVRTAEAESQIADARRAALADVDAVAADAARDLVIRLAGVDVPPAVAEQAVRSVARG